MTFACAADHRHFLLRRDIEHFLVNYAVTTISLAFVNMVVLLMYDPKADVASMYICLWSKRRQIAVAGSGLLSRVLLLHRVITQRLEVCFK